MNKYLLLFLVSLVIAGLFIALKHKLTSSNPIISTEQDIHHQFVVLQAHTLLGFDLVDPEQAPLPVRDSILRGYRIIMNTPFYAPKYARDQLSCTHCHFAGGDTLGGKNGGISLVGVSAIYPRYSKRAGKKISLAERINYCFERSLNGMALPLESQEMTDLLNYLNWISQEVKSLKNFPWLGLPELKSQHQPNALHGAQVYKTYCALCHKDDGQGGGQIPDEIIPPLWGPNSFNDGAGMSHLPKFASFVYYNMPAQDPFLTEEEALDVAAFVLEQPRDYFIEENTRWID